MKQSFRFLTRFPRSFSINSTMQRKILAMDVNEFGINRENAHNEDVERALRARISASVGERLNALVLRRYSGWRPHIPSRGA